MRYAVFRHKDGTLEVVDSDQIKDWKVRQSILCEFDNIEQACGYIEKICRYFVIVNDGEPKIVCSKSLDDYPFCTIIRGVYTYTRAKEFMKQAFEEN